MSNINDMEKEQKNILIDDNVNIDEIISSIDILSNNNNIVFDFVGTDLTKIKENLDKIIDLEYDCFDDITKNQNSFNISLKKLDSNIKIDVFEYLLTKDNIVDSYIILNIYNFIKGGNTFQDEFFACPEIYTNSFVEFLDIKSALRSELYNFMKQLCIYYLSVLKSCDKIESYMDNMIVIPVIYQRILFIADFYTMSILLNKINDINTNDTFIVNNANAFLDNWSYRQVMKKQLVDIIEKDVEIPNQEEK